MEIAQLFVLFLLLLIQTYVYGLENVPVGHLLPLGGHAKPGKVEERFDLPSAEEFWNKYVKVSKPVVFRNLAKQSPLFTKWTDKYIEENYGDLEIRLEGKKEKSSGIPKGAKGIGRDTLKNFVNTYHDNGWNKYAVTELPTPMYKDVMVPPFLGCGTLAERLVEIDLWMSGGGSKSILHKDAFNALNCLFNGTKEWKLIEYKYEPKIYQAKEAEDGYGGFSRINPEKVDLLKYPKVAEVPWSYVTVNAGDCLFLPKSMYHQVTSYGTHNLAIAILFSRFDGIKNISFTDCGQEKFKPLSDFDIDWQFPGYGDMTMGNHDLEYGVRVDLYDFFRRKRTGKDMYKLITEIGSFETRNRSEIKRRAKILFNIFGSPRGVISLGDVKNLTKDQLRQITLQIFRKEPSNTYDHEYLYVPMHSIVGTIAKLTGNGELRRSDFIQAYVDRLRGTEEFALKLFSSLGGEGKDVISKKVILANLRKALEPYKTYQNQEEETESVDSYEQEDDRDAAGEDIPEQFRFELDGKEKNDDDSDVERANNDKERNINDSNQEDETRKSKQSKQRRTAKAENKEEL